MSKSEREMRKKIIAEVAAEWSEKLGWKLSHKEVERCWDEYRKLKRTAEREGMA